MQVVIKAGTQIILMKKENQFNKILNKKKDKKESKNMEDLTLRQKWDLIEACEKLYEYYSRLSEFHSNEYYSKERDKARYYYDLKEKLVISVEEDKLLASLKEKTNSRGNIR